MTAFLSLIAVDSVAASERFRRIYLALDMNMIA